jgi:nucleoside-diphosphate-sugar epimerase
VTGGAGFIGSNLVERLVGEGERVRVLDNLSTGRWENLEPWLDGVQVIEGDLRDPEAVRRAVDGVDYVLHHAAIPSVPDSVDDPVTAHACNATGTLRLLVAARDAGVKRLVYASSCSVYGDSPELPKREEMATDPLSPYAASKLAGETYCCVFHHVYGFEAVCLRYFNVFGPRQDPGSEYSAVIPLFITAMLEGAPLTVHGDGRQSRDFVYVEDVVEANLLACRAAEAPGQVFNVASGERRTLLDLIARLSEVMGREPEVVHTPPRPGDVRHSQADISRASRVLGYEPRVSFAEGLARTVRTYARG